MTKPTKWHVHPEKTLISIVWSESSLCVQWVPKDPSFLHADRCPGWSESLLGTHATLLVLLWGGSNVYLQFKESLLYGIGTAMQKCYGSTIRISRRKAYVTDTWLFLLQAPGPCLCKMATSTTPAGSVTRCFLSLLPWTIMRESILERNLTIVSSVGNHLKRKAI